jgi:FkbM family methyltransferase
MIKKIKKSLFYFFYKLKKLIRILFSADQNITLGSLKIILSPDHNLSLYNKLYPEYDKFISTVVKDLPKNTSVIDIGANVGDTVCRMIQSNNKLHYYSIEADNYFFNYLNLNVKNFKSKFPYKIDLIKLLVGQKLQGKLIGNHGTKSLLKNSRVSDDNKVIKSKKLDEIIIKYNIKNISLIKCDTDGYDYNVIFSGINYIKKYKPDIFFEYHKLNETSQVNYIGLINKLLDIGYKSWTILNNYGKIIFKKINKKDLINLINSNQKIFDIYCSVNLKK